MRPKTRSISGALMMMAIIPILAGLLACLPEYVPLGDPDRARVDPGMNGIWFTPSDDELIGNLVMFQPWDKRTWLVTNVQVFAGEEAGENGFDPQTYEEFVELLNSEDFDKNSVGTDVLVYKGWLAKLGGQTFLMWQVRGVPNDEDDQITLEPLFAFDMRVTERSADWMTLHLIDTEFEPLQEAPFTRRGWEKVVRKYADDDALYVEEPLRLRRVRQEDLEKVAELFFDAFIDET